MILATNNSIQLCQTPQPVSQAHNQRKRLFGFRVLLQPNVTDRIELANDNECCMEDKQFKLKKAVTFLAILIDNEKLFDSRLKIPVLFLVTAIGGRPKPEICFLPGWE